jgi:SHAQKYF class myb-like DNA-binding protein
MTSKDQESKNTKIPSNICLNSPEPTKDIKRIKFLTKKLITFRVDNNTKNNYPKKIKDSKNGRWTLKEHIEFLNGIAKYGNNLSKIKINSRNSEQLRSHAQKFFKKLKKVNDEQLGINFTPNYIKNIKDMVNHIKSVNYNYDVTNVFLYLSEKYEKKRVKFSDIKNCINNNEENNEILLNEDINDNVAINVNNIENYECNDKKLDNMRIDIINNFVGYSYLNLVLMNNINEQLKHILFLLNYINNHYIEVNSVNNNDDKNKQE